MRIHKHVLVLGCALALGLAGCSRQQSDWQKAREANSTDAYEHFLKDYPSGEFTGQAQARLKELYEERDWQKARDADTSEAYQAFLKQHPEGKWTEEARIRVENFTLAQGPEAAAPGSAVPPGAASAPPGSAAPASASAGAGHAAAVVPPMTGAPSGPAAHANTGTEKHGTGTSGPSGSYGVQLGAFKSGAAAAHKHWAHLQKEFPELLAGLSSKVVPKKTAQGTIYRLQAVGVSKQRARAICKDLKAKSQACAVVRATHH